MTAQRKTVGVEPAPSREAAAAQPGPFVINLCASTTPMALAQPQTPELKRFTFFVSRRREDGRERFRLHMGYFTTLAEAEEWLSVVRDIFPGAWAGDAPGKRLRERAMASAAQIPSTSAPAPAAKVAKAAPKVAAALSPVPNSAPVVPTLQAAPAAPSVKKAPVMVKEQAPLPIVGKSAKAPLTPPQAVRPQGSNVREVLKALDETGATRLMPAPRAARPATPSAEAPLTDTQVLKILESRRADAQPRGSDAAGSAISLLRPDDTATVRALKEAVRDNAPVWFAVQLQWSVQPIDLAKMPPLAIFSAYTLYTVAGSREGRKWYGLRLGFFSDAISAKQVAHYVRSEFASVAVVPVGPQERVRATDAESKVPQSGVVRPRQAPQSRVDEFKLIDDETNDVAMPGLTAAQSQLKTGKSPVGSIKPAAARKPAPAVASRSVRKTSGKARAGGKRAPQSLEETLEILGASELEIDNGRGELLNDSGVRHLRVEVQKNSPFSRLLERLSERARKT